jgi:cytoskeletal protein CcmA (bactofilin family)
VGQQWEKQMSPVVEAGAASIGKSVEIRGEVKGSEDLMIDGHVEGTITLTDSRLTVGPTARVDADVSARDVVILGVLNGNVTASMRVDLRKGANLTGDIRAARLSIEEGSIFSGKVDLTPPGAVPAKSVPAVTPAAGAGPATSTGLFSPVTLP